MSTILKDLYYGRIRPFERDMPNSKEYSEIFEYAKETEKEFLSRLNDEERQLFEKLREAEYRTDRLDEIYEFEDAIRLGAKLMMGILVDEAHK